MITRDEIEAIREAVDLTDLVSETLHLPRRPDHCRAVMALCPFHDDHKTPSLAVYADHLHCYGCGWHGDAFDWVMRRDNVSFPQAVEALARKAGVALSSPSPDDLQAAQERREYEDALALAARHFAERLWQTPKALEYARRRWPDEAIRTEGVGYAGGDPLPALGNPQAQAVAEALNRWASKVGGAVIYVHRRRGRAVWLTARSIVGKAHYDPPGELGGAGYFYLNALYSANASELLIVEGQACAITLSGWGFPALALAGSAPARSRGLEACLARHAERGAMIYAIPDTDNRTDTKALAAAAGPLLRVVSLPDSVGDVNDYAQRGATAEDFRKLLNAAPTWLDLRIEEAAQAQGVARDRAIEALFPLLTALPPVAGARYKSRVLSALPEIKSRDYERLLRAVRQAEDAPLPSEVLEGSYPTIAPALDFLDDLGVVIVPFLTRADGAVDYRPYLISSQRELIPLDGQRFVTVAGRQVILRSAPIALPGSARWAWQDVQAYLHGDAPDCVETYNETEKLIDRYLDFRDPGISDVLALWVMGSYLYPLFEAFPYLALQGPKGSGKTKTLDVLGKLSFNARVLSSLSPASLFRIVEATRGTLCIDEVEHLSDAKDPTAADIRLLLNSGYKRGAPATRCEGDEHQVVEFEVFGPKAVASIRSLEDVLQSRCIRITMLRTAGPKGNLIVSESCENWAQARHRLYCFALQHFSGVRDAYLRGAGADGLNNRQAELWRPLLAIAAYLDAQGAGGLLPWVQDHASQAAGQAEDEGLDDWRRALLLALHKLAVSEQRAEVTPKQVTAAMSEFLDDAEVTSQWVGYRLREFGFRRRHSGKNLYPLSSEVILDLLTRYGVEAPAGA